MTSPQEDRQRFTRRAILIGGGKALLFAGLGARMYQLQVIKGDRYHALAEDNRIDVRFHTPRRGIILDRFSRPLALNRRTYRVLITPEEAENLEAALDQLHLVAPIAPEERERILRHAKRNPGFIPVPTHEHLEWDAIAKVSARIPELPGIDVVEISQRIYPEAGVAAHPIGYVGPVAKEELTKDPVLSLSDLRIGKAGVERSYDLALRGSAAESKVEVNAVGRVVRELERNPGASGDTLISTIDVELQRFAQNRMGDHTGGVVVMDIKNGDVLALASNPTYDPNVFTQGITTEDWRALSTNVSAPLNNKAVAGQYAPGSTFKMMVALAALEHGIVTPRKAFFCSGVHKVGRGRFHCWRRGGHGWVALHDAITESCDVYFYETARKVGIDRIAEMSRRFGFGDRTGVDLPSEGSGLMPTKAWKWKRFKKPWRIGETLIAGIGQGFVLATPLQLAVMTARIVNGRDAVEPRLLRMRGDQEIFPDPSALNVSPAHLRTIQRAMQAVTNSAQGTARKAQIPVRALRMGGKTGTSQVRRITRAERRRGVRKNEDLPREERDHSLFVGFAPLRNPRYACSVVIEHGGSGSVVAAPIARDILLEAQTRQSAEWHGGAPIATTAPPTNPLRRG
jgi:penicillin-binding protein 2